MLRLEFWCATFFFLRFVWFFFRDLFFHTNDLVQRVVADEKMTTDKLTLDISLFKCRFLNWFMEISRKIASEVAPQLFWIFPRKLRSTFGVFLRSKIKSAGKNWRAIEMKKNDEWKFILSLRETSNWNEKKNDEWKFIPSLRFNDQYCNNECWPWKLWKLFANEKVNVKEKLKPFRKSRMWGIEKIFFVRLQRCVLQYRIVLKPLG